MFIYLYSKRKKNTTEISVTHFLLIHVNVPIESHAPFIEAGRIETIQVIVITN